MPPEKAADQQRRTLWYTRCPVPTASSIAIDCGMLDARFAPLGISVFSLRASENRAVRESHFDHNQADSFREGGNIPPLWTRARGGDTRVIATGWIDEYQAIIAAPGSDIHAPADLRGRRLAVPRRLNDRIDYWRAMCLRGYESALALVGLGLNDVELVDLPISEKYIPSDNTSRSGSLWTGAHRARRQQAEAFALIRGQVDAIYTAGAPGAQLAAFLGAVDVIDLGRHPDRAVRVNNQVPIVLTVTGALLRDRPDLVRAYLEVLVQAAEWAASHRAETIRTVANDVGAGEEWVVAAYGDFHTCLMPRLSHERIAALEGQKDFLLRHGFIDGDVGIADWVDPAPLESLGLVE